MATTKETVIPGAVGEAGSEAAEVMSPLRILGGESNLYTKPPAVEVGRNLMVLRTIEKRFHAFLRCRAAFSAKDVAGGDLGALKMGASVSEFREDVARVSPTAVLGPIEGGEPLVIYVARPGREEDFGEILPDFQEDGRERLAIFNDENGKPMMVVFGEEKWKEKWEQKPEAEGKAEAKAGLPAFLEEGEAPEGYESLVGKWSSAVLRPEVGKDIVFYFGKHGARLVKNKNGEVFFRLEEMSWPQEALYFPGNSSPLPERIPPQGIPLGRTGPLKLTRSLDRLLKREGWDGLYLTTVYFFGKRGQPGTSSSIELAKGFSFPDETTIDVFSDYDDFESIVELCLIKDGGVRVTNKNGRKNIFVPAVAMVKEDARAGAEAGAEVEVSAEKRMAGAEQGAAEWKEVLKGKGNELAKNLEDYIKEESLDNLVNLLKGFTNLGVGVYLERPEAVGEEEFGQQAGGFDEAAEVMIGYFRQIQPRNTSRVFQRLQEKYTETEWRYDLKIYFSTAADVDEFIAESSKEEQANYAVLGAAALTRVGQLVFSRVPEGVRVDIEGLRRLYQEAVERYLSRLTSISK